MRDIHKCNRNIIFNLRFNQNYEGKFKPRMPQATLIKDIQLFHLLCVVMNYNYRLQCVQLNVQWATSTVIHMQQTCMMRPDGGSHKTKNTFNIHIHSKSDIN